MNIPVHLLLAKKNYFFGHDTITKFRPGTGRLKIEPSLLPLLPDIQMSRQLRTRKRGWSSKQIIGAILVTHCNANENRR